jgi:phage gp45-like
MSLARVGAALRSMVTRGKVVQSGVGARVIVQVQGLDKEQWTVEMLHPFGMSGRPKRGSDVVLLQVLGSRDHVVAIGGDAVGGSIGDLAEGEVGISGFGARIVFRADRLEVTSNIHPVKIKAAHSVTFDTPELVTTGNVIVGSGATGSFTTPTGQVVTVRDGIIVNIF